MEGDRSPLVPSAPRQILAPDLSGPPIVQPSALISDVRGYADVGCQDPGSERP